MANDAAFAQPQPPQTSEDGTVTLVSIPFAGEASDAQSESAVDAVTASARSVRAAGLRRRTPASSSAATRRSSKDFFDISDPYTPIIIALVLGLSFILLTVVFRSIVVPAKAIVMNLLSVGAAYGLIALIFQKGGPSWATSIADALGFIQVEAIESWLPLFLFSILFGLSMDYQVFLLTRIREEYDKTKDNSEAVAFGLRTTGGIITGAAVIMVAVFAAFASGRIAALQQMGFGLAVAVFLDATIVRSILVPSAMKLLGDRNWYLPRWLQWLPKIDVEGHDGSVVEVPRAGGGRANRSDQTDVSHATRKGAAARAAPFRRSWASLRRHGTEHDAVREPLGRVGVWTFGFDDGPAAAIAGDVRAIEEAGYPGAVDPRRRRLQRRPDEPVVAARRERAPDGRQRHREHHRARARGARAGAAFLRETSGIGWSSGIGVGTRTPPCAAGSSGTGRSRGCAPTST